MVGWSRPLASHLAESGGIVWASLQPVYFTVFRSPYRNLSDFLCRRTRRADLGLDEQNESLRNIWEAFMGKCGLEWRVETGPDPRASLDSIFVLLLILWSGRTLPAGPRGHIAQTLRRFDDLLTDVGDWDLQFCRGGAPVRGGKLHFRMLCLSMFPELADVASSLAVKWTEDENVVGPLVGAAVLLRGSALSRARCPQSTAAVAELVGKIISSCTQAVSVALLTGGAEGPLLARPPTTGAARFTYGAGRTTQMSLRDRARQVGWRANARECGNSTVSEAGGGGGDGDQRREGSHPSESQDRAWEGQQQAEG